MKACLLISAFAVSLCGLSAMGDRPQQEEDCFIGPGDNIYLCGLSNSRSGEDCGVEYGVILQYAKGLSSGFYWLRGPDTKIEYWTSRGDIGDPEAAVVWEPAEPPDKCEDWDLGVGQIPPIVAVRLSGEVVRLDDHVYANPPTSLCAAGEGDLIRLCDIYHSMSGEDCGVTYGLVLKFETGVDSMTCELGGPDAAIEYWTVRADIGDSSEATFLEPVTPPDECDTWVKEFGSDPPIVGVRLFGEVVEIDEIVYSG